MKSKTLLSIIVPVYNCEEFLPRCLNSLINQSLKEIEIICVNDGSKDNSLEIINDFAKKDDRFKVFSQENSGPATARNVGLRSAKGKYIMFCDSDDAYESTACEDMFVTIEKEQVDFVMCNTIEHMNEDTPKLPTKSYLFPFKNGKYDMSDDISLGLNVFLWNKIFKKSLIEDYEITFPDGHTADDNYFIFQYCSVSESVFFLDKNLYNHFDIENSIMNNFHSNNIKLKDIFDRIDIMEYFYLFIEKHLLWNKKNLFCRLFEKELAYTFLSTGYAWEKDVFQKLQKSLLKMTINDWGNEYINDTVIALKEGHWYRSRKFLTFLTKKICPHRKRRTFLGQSRPLPAFPENNIPICFNCDNNYLNYFNVTLMSIIENSRQSTYYDIVVLHQDIDVDKQQEITNQVKEFKNISLRFFDMEEILPEEHSHFKAKSGHINLTGYYRLFIGNIFKNYEKVIYLDSDLILNTDIADLFKISLNQKSALAVKDYLISRLTKEKEDHFFNGFLDYCRKTLKISDITNYFNSGVMVFDIKKINDNHYEEKFLEIAKLPRYFHDQDILNSALQNDVELIDPKWNFQVNFAHNSNLSPTLLPFEEEYDNLKIIHFSSNRKPWFSIQGKYYEKWWAFARKTPHHEQLFFEFVKRASKLDMHANGCNPRFKKHRHLSKYIRYKIGSTLPLGKIQKKYQDKLKKLKGK